MTHRALGTSGDGAGEPEERSCGMRVFSRPRPGSRTGFSVTIPVLTDEDEREGRAPRELSLALRRVEEAQLSGSERSLLLHTDDGLMEACLHSPAAGARRGVVWLSGAGGGLDGPAAQLYPALCERLCERRVAALRLDYRHPNELADSILDALIGVGYLARSGCDRIAVVGHSFGGAVAISTAALSSDVTAVVALSTQTYGADLAPQVAPRPLLLMHGTEDEILPPVCSEIVFAAAREPKELRLLDGASHGLDAAREEVMDVLTEWLVENV
jgi:dienelactone hydrolase